jgi:uncharacterized protein YfaQ (DUF2300 family)
MPEPELPTTGSAMSEIRDFNVAEGFWQARATMAQAGRSKRTRRIYRTVVQNTNLVTAGA